jgi:hypothetical protein
MYRCGARFAKAPNNMGEKNTAPNIKTIKKTA